MKRFRSIALTGLKHVGKSTLGRVLAQKMNCEYVDLDDLLIRRAIHENLIAPDQEDDTETPPIRRVFRKLGSAAFNAWEADAIRDIPDTYHGAGLVLATGGGVCDHPETMELLTTGYYVLYLENDPIVLYQRAVHRGIPAFINPDRPREHFLELAAHRDTLYRRYADEIVDITGLSPEESIARMLEHHKG